MVHSPNLRRGDVQSQWTANMIAISTEVSFFNSVNGNKKRKLVPPLKFYVFNLPIQVCAEVDLQDPKRALSKVPEFYDCIEHKAPDVQFVDRLPTLHDLRCHHL